MSTAATYTWNTDSGAWDTSSTNWTGPQTTWTGIGTDCDARFQTAGGTISIPSAIIANDLSFLASGYRVEGGTLLLNGSPVITVGEGLSATIGSVMTGTAPLTKAGAGTLLLTGANSRSGNTTIANGTLKVTGSGRLYAGAANDTAVVTVASGGVLELDTWYLGDDQSLGRLGAAAQRIVVNSGTIRVNGTTGSGRGMTINSGGATLEAAAGADWMLHTFTDNADFVYNGNPSLTLCGAGIGRFEKVFSGAGSVTKRGPGQWTLRRSNTYTGNTTVEQGVLTLIRPSLADASTVTIAKGGVLDLWFTGSDAVGQLILDSVAMPPGTYNRATHPRYFTGAGNLVVGGTNSTSTLPLRYGLAGGNETWPANYRQEIINGMDYAVGMYNSYGHFDAFITASYNAGVPTAQCSYGGWVEFGGMRSGRVAMHEFEHFFGVGTQGAWGANVVNGQWAGTHALNLVRQFDGPGATLSSDGTHFWPYGLNYDSESSTRNDTISVRLVEAFRRDMGLVNAPSITPPGNSAVAPGGAAGPLTITVADAETAAANLVVIGSSSNPTLVPNANIHIGGSGGTRTVTVIPAPGQTGMATINLTVLDGLDATTTSFPLGVGMLEASITSSPSDAEEATNGTVSLASSDLELVNDEGTGAGDQLVGLRFSRLPLPPGALITSASIQFSADEAHTRPTALRIAAQTADNATTFLTNAFNLSKRPVTSTKVMWEPGTWPSAGESGLRQRTPNLAALVQEIVNRPGWRSGNAIAFLITGSGCRTADAFDKAGGTPPKFTVTFLMPTNTLACAIAGSADDAEQAASGAVNLASSDLELSNDDATGAGNQIVGLRFASVALPPNAVIRKACIQFKTDEVQTNATALTIGAEASDQPAAFTTNAFDLSSRPLLAQTVAWAPAPWSTEDEMGAAQRTPDLTALVQALVARPGWTNGSAMAFLISGTGRRTADACDKASAIPATLLIDYTPGNSLAGSYANWLTGFTNLAGADPEADSDGDGLNNRSEFAFGLHPERDDARPFSLERDDTGLSLRYTRSSTASRVDFAVEWCDSLSQSNWTTTGVQQEVLADDGAMRTIRARVDALPGTQRYLRLKVTGP